MEYYSAFKKNRLTHSVLVRWMKLEPVIHSEVSQKEKDKYFILTHNEPVCKAAEKTQTWRTDLWTQDGEGEGGTERH